MRAVLGYIRSLAGTHLDPALVLQHTDIVGHLVTPGLARPWLWRSSPQSCQSFERSEKSHAIAASEISRRNYLGSK
jgi:hypothetical protein